ncbi:hypothetical protein BRADI_1g26457v3 [Brachypodium distachyon]|uniref:Rab3GAP catalytic subunit conserved domain-containing protein n=1 Tax=Brachypodium distachyon TaxID=15368 RepID=A0A0Q3H051_BRADI|nr:hypothetical protein BRADI_1g26457v3 [Brachypodium distachyon]
MDKLLPPPPPAPPASSTSLVSRARTAIHSAAARAERVLTDIKADLRDADGSGGHRAPSPRTSMDRQADAGASATEQSPDVKPPLDEVPEVIPSSNENGLNNGLNIELGSSTSSNLTFPPAAIVKQLIAGIENGKKFKSMNDMKFNGDQYLKEKGSLSLSVVKSLVRREKEDRSSSEFFGDNETKSLMYLLFRLEEEFPDNDSRCSPELLHSASLSRDIHGAPPGSFVHQLGEIIGSISSVHKMAFFWQSVVAELKKLWSDGQPVPRMSLNAAPDLNCCLLYQEIQVINCCIARKKRRKAAKESLDSLRKRECINNSDPMCSNGESCDNGMYASNSSGDFVLRLGADCASENLTLLETGEPVYSPTLQEGPIMTAELIKETEELVLRTGSVGAGCSQLLSDMQAFKAANPGCVLEDFIRWHSPPDWSEDSAASNTTVEEGSSRRGRLSDRMRTKEGNLWKELWDAAKPIPAVEQTPIYDEDLAVESIFDALEVIEPAKLFQQLLSVIVYETMEAIVSHPEEALQITEQPDEKSAENKNRFKLKLNFTGKDGQSLWKRAAKDVKKTSPKDEKKSPEEKNANFFSNLRDKKVSIFSKKTVKETEVPPPPPSSALGSFDESDWMIL